MCPDPNQAGGIARSASLPIRPLRGNGGLACSPNYWGEWTAMENLNHDWGCHGTEIDGADGTAIGTGYQNTLDIVAGCSDTPIAASEALAYEGGGYSDWYLPSFDELSEDNLAAP